jgi:hypothetical protein
MKRRAKEITLYDKDFKYWSKEIPALGRRLKAAKDFKLDVVLVKVKFSLSGGVHSMRIFSRKTVYNGGEFDGFIKHLRAAKNRKKL